jgi:hypothetical protein
MFATNDQLRVVDKEEAVAEHTQEAIGHVHSWTYNPHHD